MTAERDRKDALLEAGLTLASELPLPIVLQRVVDLAARVTDARYGALGVIGAGGELVEFVTTGISAKQRRDIGALPIGRGVLGLLIQEPRPVRIRNIADHPRSVGFPPNHPPMHSFLGAPVGESLRQHLLSREAECPGVQRGGRALIGRVGHTGRGCRRERQAL